MKRRKIISLVLVLLGVIVFLFAMYAKNRVMNARESISETSGLFPHNPISEGVGKALEHKVGAYDTPILIGLIGGVALIVIGVGFYFSGRKRH